MEKSIKYTFKYLLNDGLLGCFVNAIVLNNRLDRICRELDSLGFQPNVFDSSSVCEMNDEKDDVLLPRRRKGCKRGKGLVKTRDDRYLTAEVGLGSMKASAPPTYRCRGRACKRAATYDSPSNEKIDRTERMESCWNREDTQDTFRSNDPSKNFPMQSRLNEKKSFHESREEKGSSSLDPVKRLPREQGTIKRSSLKLIIRKAQSLDCSCSISLKPIRSCSLPLPCKANDVTKEIFQADPGLHESCLIVMRRKFETGIFNLCSCLNDVLGKINEKIISDLCLILEIRPGYINFKLIGKEDRESRSCLFINRVPICQSVHKRDIGKVIENSIDSKEVSSFNEFYDTFNDAVASGETKNIDEGNCKELWSHFSSLCPETSSNEVERTLVGKIDMEEKQETQLLLDFSVTRRTEKEESVSSSVARRNDDTLTIKKETEDILGAVNSKLEINCQCKKSVEDFMRCSMMEENVSESVARINDDTFVSKKKNENVLEKVSSKLETNCQCRKSVEDFMRYPTMKENVSETVLQINDDKFVSEKKNKDGLEKVIPKLEINIQCKKSVEDFMRYPRIEENVSESVTRINDDTSVSQKENKDVIEAVSSNLEINCQYKIKNVDDLSKCSTIDEERFEPDEEIELNLTVECTCCSSCGIPILSSNIDEEIDISKNKNEIWNFMKYLLTEIVEKIDTKDTVTTNSLKNEDNSNLIQEEDEESFSCDCSMSLDSLITRKTFHQEEINSDCDSRCSCRSKVPSSVSSSSLDRKCNEDFPSSGVLKNEDKFSSSVPNEIEEIDVSRTKNNSIIRLLDTPKNQNEMVCSKYREENIVCNRKDFVSLSIQTSRTRTLSKFTSIESSEEEAWMREFEKEKRTKNEQKRVKPSKIWKPHKKGSPRRRPMQILPEDVSQRSFLPTRKRSICTCHISKRCGHRGRRRFKDDSWTSRIKKYISFRRSNFVSSSFCESFYSSRRSIGRLRNLVRTKLRRLMSSNGKNEIDRSKRTFPVYQKVDETKKSHLVYDVRIKNRNNSFESETLRTIYRKRRSDEKLIPQNSHDFFLTSSRHNFSIEKDKRRNPEKNFIHNLQSYQEKDRYSKERRSMTYSYSKIDDESSIREDNWISASSTGKRLVRRKVESGKGCEKWTDSKRTFEFVFDKRFWDEVTDNSSTVDEYEKFICELGLDFRSKLEQYVALCKNIKYSLIGNTKGSDICQK